MEEQLTDLDEEIELVNQEALSAEIMTQSYRDLPQMLDAVAAADDRHSLKEIISCFIHTIRWSQDEGDATTGTVEVEFFEEAQPMVNWAKENLDAALVNNGASRCIERLLDKDSNLGPSG